MDSAVSTGLESILAKISDDTKAYEEIAEKQAEEEVNRIINDYSLEAETLIKKSRLAAEAAVKEIEKRTKSSVDMLYRKMINVEKAALVDEAFSRALTRIRSFSEEDYALFIGNILQKLISENKRNSILMFCERDLASGCAKRITDKLQKQLKQEKIDIKLTLSENAANIIGGFIALQDDIEINCSLEKIVAQSRPRLEKKVADTLFSK